MQQGQVAYYLSFKEVVTISMDYRYVYSGKLNETHLLQSDESNHFAPDYSGDQQCGSPDLTSSEASYWLANQVFAASSWRIIDATLSGACTIFEKQQYTSLFKQER